MNHLKYFCALLCVTWLFLFSQTTRTQADQWFDSYGKISWPEERLHLDNFARFLQQNPDNNGYVAYYVGKGDTQSNLKKRMTRVKNYLARDLKIDKSRIFIVSAGKAEKRKIILQPVPKSSPPPRF